MKHFLAFMIVFSAILLTMAVSQASAATGLPCDADGDSQLTASEVKGSVISYMSGNGNVSLDDVRDATYVYTYWNGKPKTITDSINRTITIYRPIKRIVALGNYRTEVVKILGESDKLVGVDTNTRTSSMHYYPELASLPDVGTWSAPNYEKLIELKPDIVITSANTQRVSDCQNKLASAGIIVIGLDCYRPNMIDAEISKLAYLLDEEKNATKYIEWESRYEKVISDYLSSHPDEKNPTIFMEWGTSFSTYGKGSTGQSVCDIAGGNNIASGLDEYPKIGVEWVVKQNPEVIVRTVSSTGWGWNNTSEPAKSLDEMKKRPGWSEISAFKNNRSYIINSELTWGPDQIVGIAYYAKWLHPGLEIDPEAIYKEYLNEFMHIDYPKGRVFVYP